MYYAIYRKNFIFLLVKYDIWGNKIATKDLTFMSRNAFARMLAKFTTKELDREKFWENEEIDDEWEFVFDNESDVDDYADAITEFIRCHIIRRKYLDRKIKEKKGSLQ